MTRLAPVLLSLVWLCASCTSSAPVRPEVELPARFSSSGAASTPDRWWLALGDPALTGLVDTGLEANPGLLATWDRLAQAEASARREGASRFPTLDASADGGSSVSGGGGEIDGSTSFSLGLAASYELDLWGGIEASRDAAVLEARATGADLRAAAITLSAEIALTWYELVEARRQEELLERQLEVATRTLDIVSERYRVGVIPETDLLRQKQQVESIRGDQTLAAAQRQVLEHSLAILLGRPPNSALPASTDPAQLPPLPATGVPGELVQRRPDIVASLYRIQAQDERVAAAIADRFPRLSLSLRAATNGALPQDLFKSWLSSIAGSLLAPIFDGGRREAEVDRARAALSESLHQYQGDVLAALGEVEDALVRELSQTTYLSSLDQQLELARAAYQRTEAAYRAGAVDFLRVLDAESTLQSLERRRLTAEHDRISYRIALYRALAGGWSLPRPQG